MTFATMSDTGRQHQKSRNAAVETITSDVYPRPSSTNPYSVYHLIELTGSGPCLVDESFTTTHSPTPQPLLSVPTRRFRRLNISPPTPSVVQVELLCGAPSPRDTFFTVSKPKRKSTKQRTSSLLLCGSSLLSFRPTRSTVPPFP